MEQAPVAGHVQHVQAPFAREMWKNCLVPRDICHRVAKTFGHGDDVEGVTKVFEEREIALEHERGEAVVLILGQQRAEQSKEVLGNARLSPLDDGGGDADVHWCRRKLSRRAMRKTLRTAPRALVNRSSAPRLSA